MQCSSGRYLKGAVSLNLHTLRPLLDGRSGLVSCGWRLVPKIFHDTCSCVRYLSTTNCETLQANTSVRLQNQKLRNLRIENIRFQDLRLRDLRFQVLNYGRSRELGLRNQGSRNLGLWAPRARFRVPGTHVLSHKLSYGDSDCCIHDLNWISMICIELMQIIEIHWETLIENHGKSVKILKFIEKSKKSLNSFENP